MISILKIAEIRHKMKTNDVVAARDPVTAAELAAVHGIPGEQVKVLLCCPDDKILILTKTEYERLAKEEEDIVAGL